MKIVVKMRGTCGELAQGFFRGEPILITCPIEKYSTVTISEELTGAENLGAKSLAMVDKVLKMLGVKNLPYGLKLTSELPRGKGLASSSADTAAVAQAVALSFGQKFSAEDLGKLCAQIEPTDGIFFDGVVAMNPLTGKFIKSIRAQEKFLIAVFDYGGTVNTVEFNRRSDFEITALDDVIDFALTKKSALANQKILPKRGLNNLIEFAEDFGAVGVNIAHSGTVVGIFFHADDLHVDEKICDVRKRFEFLSFMMLTSLAV
ncbi:MAG: GHMP kinase [Selenomonadaceae bacterium]|nr:GHMP kinase [Selenomonadaceae bacterium]